MVTGAGVPGPQRQLVTHRAEGRRIDARACALLLFCFGVGVRGERGGGGGGGGTFGV